MAEPRGNAALASSFEEACRDRLTPSRRYDAGAGGVRGMLTTILGEFARRTGQPAPSAALINVLGRFGVGEKASRQALLRASKDGWFIPVRSGRQTLWKLTPAFEQFLNGGEEKIYGFTAVQPQWDRRWLLVLARVTEDNRAGRHLLETRLSWAGFGNPAPGVWISTYTDRVGEAEQVLKDAGVRKGAQIFLAEHLAGDELPSLVGQAWDLDGLGREYEAFVAEFTRNPSDDPLLRLARLVHAWRRFRLIDPTLPRELLPAGWSGIRAARLFHRQHERWRPAAMAEWRRICTPSNWAPGEGH
jgi:phenylacetic acid degradation operon negative regulatory protein